MPLMLGTAAKIERRSNIPYIGVHLMAASDSKYYIYTNNLSRIPISSYYSRIYIWISGSSGPSEKRCKKYSEVPL